MQVVLVLMCTLLLQRVTYGRPTLDDEEDSGFDIVPMDDDKGGCWLNNRYCQL